MEAILSIVSAYEGPLLRNGRKTKRRHGVENGAVHERASIGALQREDWRRESSIQAKVVARSGGRPADL